MGSAATSPARFNVALCDRRSSLSLRSSETMASSCRILSVLPSTSIGGGVADVADASFFSSSNLAETDVVLFLQPVLLCNCGDHCLLGHLQTFGRPGHVLLTLVQPLAWMTVTRTHPCLVDDGLQVLCLGRLLIQRRISCLQLGQLRCSLRL